MARKFFTQWIKTYWNEMVITEEQLVFSEGKVEFYIKEKIARRFAEQLMKDGMIEFENNKDHSRFPKLFIVCC